MGHASSSSPIGHSKKRPHRNGWSESQPIGERPRRFEATQGNGTQRDSCSTAVRPHRASRTRSAPPRDREPAQKGPTRDFLDTRGRSLGHWPSTRSGPSPARSWLMSRTSRTRSASAERARTSPALSRSTRERHARLSAPLDRRSSEPAAGERSVLRPITHGGAHRLASEQRHRRRPYRRHRLGGRDEETLVHRRGTCSRRSRCR